MEMKSLFLVFAILLFACESKIEHTSFNTVEQYIVLTDYQGESLIEKSAAVKAKNYLKSKGLNLDDFFVWNVSYPDLLDSMHEQAFTLVFDLAHRKTLDYIDSIETINSSLLEEHKNDEFIPLAVPVTGNISGLDRHIYYYFEQDSVVDVLSQ